MNADYAFQNDTGERANVPNVLVILSDGVTNKTEKMANITQDPDIKKNVSKSKVHPFKAKSRA